MLLIVETLVLDLFLIIMVTSWCSHMDLFWYSFKDISNQFSHYWKQRKEKVSVVQRFWWFILLQNVQPGKDLMIVVSVSCEGSYFECFYSITSASIWWAIFWLVCHRRMFVYSHSYLSSLLGNCQLSVPGNGGKLAVMFGFVCSVLYCLNSVRAWAIIS